MSQQCVICATWEKLPFQARYSTPVEVRDVEVVLVTGFLVRGQQPPGVAARLCQKHVQMLALLDVPLPVPGSLAQSIVAPALAAQFPGVALPLGAGAEARTPEPGTAGRVQFECPDCRQQVTTGDVHACPGPAASAG